MIADDTAIAEAANRLTAAGVYDEYVARSVVRLGVKGGGDPGKFAQYILDLAAWERRRSGPLPTYGS